MTSVFKLLFDPMGFLFILAFIPAAKGIKTTISCTLCSCPFILACPFSSTLKSFFVTLVLFSSTSSLPTRTMSSGQQSVG